MLAEAHTLINTLPAREVVEDVDDAGAVLWLQLADRMPEQFDPDLNGGDAGAQAGFHRARAIGIKA